MSGLVIDTLKCRGCGRCVRTCGSSALVMENRKARVTDACVLCGMCVDSCPFNAIAIEKTTAPGAESTGDVWVFAQVDVTPEGDVAVAPVALELLGKGRELADAAGGQLVALLALPGDAASDEVPTQAHGLIGHGADEVRWCRAPQLADHDTMAHTTWICAQVEDQKPAMLLTGATGFGRELAPSVAVRLRTGLTADCTVLGFDAESGLLQQTRPAFGGNLMATIVCPDHRPQMATVRPGVFSAPEADPARQGACVRTGLPAEVAGCGRPAVRVTGRQAGTGAGITDARRLIVVGRGIGSAKALPVIRELAELLGAEIGCSRPLVEAGWLTYEHQVGQTGVSVAPELLVSIGVSGAIQHLAGIGGAEQVIAINSDPDAPIFGVAQHCLVGDAMPIVCELIASLRD